MSRTVKPPSADGTKPPTIASDAWWRDDDACLEHLFTARHANKQCPCCGRRGRYYRNANKPCYTCACGRSQLFPRKGTLFQDSPLPLSKWFYAIWLVAQSGGAIQAATLQRSLGVTYVTAWRLRRKLQERLTYQPPVRFDRLLAQCLSRR